MVIETENNSAENKYLQSAALNGNSISNYWINSSELMQGETLKIEMGAEPNKTWGVGTPPPSTGKE